jgi:hypothetical protein
MKTGVLLLGLALQNSWVWADDAAMLRCRALAESGPRLACYDALANGIGSAAKSASVAPSAPTVAGAAPAANVPPPTPPLQATSQFGLERQAAQAQTESIQSRIDGKFEGWVANALLTFANGQVWQISDGSRAYVELVNPKVSVRRGFMGAYYLDIDGSNLTPRVRRVK